MRINDPNNPHPVLINNQEDYNKIIQRYKHKFKWSSGHLLTEWNYDIFPYYIHFDKDNTITYCT